MAELRIKNIDESEIDTVLAEDVEFEGELEFNQPLLVKGRFKGEIRSAGALFINETADVEAKVEASTISVKGRLKGDAIARKRLELFSSSRLEGSVHTPDLIVQSGCLFNGTCRMEEAHSGGTARPHKQEATGE